MQATGSPSRKYENNSFKIFFLGFSEHWSFPEKAVPVGLSPHLNK